MEIQKQVPPLAEIKVSKLEEAQVEVATKPVDRQYEKLSMADVFEVKQAITAERNLKPNADFDTKKFEAPTNQVSLKSNTTASFSEQHKSQSIQSPTKTKDILAEISRTKAHIVDIGPDEGA
jgi:hypothetical protein